MIDPQIYATLRESSLFFERPQLHVISLEGPDAATYLQSQTTQDVVRLPVGDVLPNALVDRKARVQSVFLTVRTAEDAFLLVVDNPSGEALFKHLEAFHFVEELTLEHQVQAALLCLGPQSLYKVGLLLNTKVPTASYWATETHQLVVTDFWGELGVLVLGPLLALPMASEALLHLIQLEGGKPRYGVDMSDQDILPETGWQTSAVSYDKGCYLGQEVIARIKTYGVVPRALVYLVFSESSELPATGTFQIDGKDRGRITQVVTSRHLSQPLALAYLHKNHRQFGQELTFEQYGNHFQAQVKSLPLRPATTRQKQAQMLYERALDIFAGDKEAEALPLLEQAIAYDPRHADAYESLGVILSRQGHHEKAIAVMTQLTEVAPDTAMAHTNLSRFYMLLGDKETAEHHMAEATKLSMKAQFSEQKAKQAEAQAQAAKQEMIAMFKEVLETEDSDDLVANYGLGKAYHDLQQYEDAKPYLKKATELDKLYSSAYLYYAKTLLALGEKDTAQNVIEQGIHAATEKGDLMPLNSLEQLKKAIFEA